MGSVADPLLVRAQVEKMCAHPLFAQAHRLTALLRFTVEEALAGRGDSLKEYTLGVQVFERGEAYDPATDPAVRVYVARLRSKLIEYYATAGAGDQVVIEIPKGGYTPIFKSALSLGGDPPLTTPLTMPLPTPLTTPLTTAAVSEPQAPGAPRRRMAVAWAAIAILPILGIGVAAYRYWHAPRPMPSVAVLPFVNMSASPDAEFYSDGLSEEIINALSQLPGLRVVARTSTFQFKGKSQDVRRIGRELNVAAVLEGSVRRDGPSLRITAQLIDTTDGYHLWSGTYDRPVNQIFATQSEIAEMVARTLRTALVDDPPRRLVRPSTSSVEAYDLYLQGRYAWNRWTDVGFEKATHYFEQAIAADPRFAPAYAGLANSYALLGLYGVMAPRDAMPKAEAMAARSLAVDDTLAEGHSAAGLAKYLLKWDREGAERDMRRALALNPGYADAHHFYAHMLALAGRSDESMLEIRQALALDPLSLVLRSDIGWTYYLNRQTARAESELQQTLTLDPAFADALYDLGITYIQAGRFQDAVRTLEKAKAQFASQEVMGALGYAYARAGQEREARDLVSTLEAAAKERYVSPASLALVHMGLHESDKAFEWLDRAVEARDPFLLLVEVDSIFDAFRGDPRFAALRQRVVRP